MLPILKGEQVDQVARRLAGWMARFRSRVSEIFLLIFVSRLVLGFTQLPIKWLPGAFLGCKSGRTVGLASLRLPSAVAVYMKTLASIFPVGLDGL